MRWSDRVGRHVLSNLLEATGTDLHSSISIDPKHIVKVIQIESPGNIQQRSVRTTWRRQGRVGSGL